MQLLVVFFSACTQTVTKSSFVTKTNIGEHRHNWAIPTRRTIRKTHQRARWCPTTHGRSLRAPDRTACRHGGGATMAACQMSTNHSLSASGSGTMFLHPTRHCAIRAQSWHIMGGIRRHSAPYGGATYKFYECFWLNIVRVSEGALNPNSRRDAGDLSAIQT